jgi:RHS repeat-associated protein
LIVWSGYTGKERDGESGNDYFGARYYGSSMGRFISPDWSAKAQAVPYAKLSNPQTSNLYAYVQNNPLRTFDPDGHNAFTSFFSNTFQRIENGVSGNGFQTNAQLAAQAAPNATVTDTETYSISQTTTTTVDLFGNAVAQAGGNYSFGGASLSYVPSTGNVYGRVTGGTPGVGIFGVVGPTSDLNQSGPSESVAAFFGIGGTVSVTPDGATTTGVGLGTPGVGYAGGYTTLLGTLPAATFNINTLNLPDSPSVYPSGGFYVDGEYNSYGQHP